MIEHHERADTAGSPEGDHNGSDHSDSGMQRMMYLRFGAMILTSMVLMYFVMFVGSWELSHVRFSQSRIFMAVTMGGVMGLVMLMCLPMMGQALAKFMTEISARIVSG